MNFIFLLITIITLPIPNIRYILHNILKTSIIAISQLTGRIANPLPLDSARKESQVPSIPVFSHALTHISAFYFN